MIEKNTVSLERMGQGAVLLCAVFWSTSGLFIRLIDWHPFVIAGMRSLVAALFMLTLRLLSPSRRRAPFKLRPLLPAGIAYSITLFSFVTANTLTTAANAILIQYSAPVWAALLGWLLAKEKPKPVNWISLVMVTGGLFLFFGGGLEGGYFVGNILALVSGISFGASTVFMRMQKDGDPADALLLSHIITAAVSIPFLFMFQPALTFNNIAPLLFMGIIQIGLASQLFAYGIRLITAVQATLTAAIEPILNPIWVFIILGEAPAFTALLGGVVIIFAVVISAIDFQGGNKKRR